MDLTAARQTLSEANPPRGGDCYEAAVKYLMDHGTLGLRGPGDNPDLLLVHGEVTGQGPLEGIKYGHAWIEDGDTVIDTSNGRDLKMPKVLYYGLGRIHSEFPPFKPNVIKYTAEEARRMLVKHMHYGPWDLKTSTGL